ncbi:hypothetical protein NDU88_011492 [Pleurodeles waltl]|uniref:Uncharacterized protein n=1 Tax=Pleurodeles waltl TaxID=8319 RepID=A0AAV7Q1U9_PLEWA|nr:hypothetical protein NDU88_011492 [Pleurodeles waltl]
MGIEKSHHGPGHSGGRGIRSLAAWDDTKESAGQQGMSNELINRPGFDLRGRDAGGGAGLRVAYFGASVVRRAIPQSTKRVWDGAPPPPPHMLVLRLLLFDPEVCMLVFDSCISDAGEPLHMNPGSNILRCGEYKGSITIENLEFHRNQECIPKLKFSQALFDLHV